MPLPSNNPCQTCGIFSNYSLSHTSASLPTNALRRKRRAKGKREGGGDEERRAYLCRPNSLRPLRLNLPLLDSLRQTLDGLAELGLEVGDDEADEEESVAWVNWEGGGRGTGGRKVGQTPERRFAAR